MISTRITRLHVATFAAILIATAATVSAHVVRGLISPTGATAICIQSDVGKRRARPAEVVHRKRRR